MSIAGELSIIKDQVSFMHQYFDTERKAGGKKVKMPRKARAAVRRGLKKNKILVQFFGSNKHFDSLVGYIDGGLIRVGDDQFEYDPTAVYFWKKGKIPVYGVVQWRLTPVGGKADAYQGYHSVGSEEAEAYATRLNLKNYGQKTIIRGIEAEEVGADAKKKKKPKLLLWIILGVAAIYLLSKVFNGG